MNISPSYVHTRLEQQLPSHLARLAALVTALGDLRLVNKGAAADQDPVRPIIRATGGVALALTGRASLRNSRQSWRCALFVGADAGAMHIAGTVGTPTIGLMGPTDVGRFAPWPQDALTVSLPCSTIRRAREEDRGRTCLYPTPRCMADLTPEMPYEAVVRRVDSSAGGDLTALTPGESR